MINQYLGERLFKEASHRPFYALADEAVFKQVTQKCINENLIGFGGAQTMTPVDFFVSVCRDTLDMDPSSAANVFRFYRGKIELWEDLDQTESVTYPPVLTLLVMMCCGWYRVESSGAFSKNDFYSPMCEFLVGNLERERTRFESSFKEVIFDLFKCLDDWLESHDGLYGYPSVFSQGHAYVGLIRSQVLLKQVDLVGLEQFFVDEGYNAHEEISFEDMSERLGQAAVTNRLHKTLDTLATDPDAGRGWLAERACFELQAWDGSVEHKDEQGRVARFGGLVLNAMYSQRMDLIQLHLHSESDQAKAGQYEIRCGDDNNGNNSSGIAGLKSGTSTKFAYPLGIESVLDRNVSFCHPSGDRLNRDYKPVVVMRADGECNYIECKHLELSRYVLILCRDTYAQPVYELLCGTVQKPSSAKRPQYLPDGWVVFGPVQFMQEPPSEYLSRDGFEVFATKGKTVITLEHGFKLARNLWHQSNPPMVTVATNVQGVCHLGIGTKGKGVKFRLGSFQRVYRKSLRSVLKKLSSSKRLELSLTKGDGTKPLSVTSFALKRAHLMDSPSKVDCAQFGNPVTANGMHVFGVAPGADDAEFTRILGYQVTFGRAICEVSHSPEGLEEVSRVIEQTDWPMNMPPVERNSMPPQPVFEDVEKPKCAVDVGCRWRVVHEAVKRKRRRVEGGLLRVDPNFTDRQVCEYCGRSRPVGATGAGSELARRFRSVAQSIDPSQYDQMETPDVLQVDGNIFFDGLCVLKSGKAEKFKHLVAQLDDQATFRYRGGLLRLGSLGHLTLRSSVERLIPTDWCVTPASLIYNSESRSLFVVGFRTETLSCFLAAIAAEIGVTFRVVRQPATDGEVLFGPDAWLFEEVVESQAVVIQTMLREDYEVKVELFIDAHLTLLSVLPDVDIVVRGLPVRLSSPYQFFEPFLLGHKWGQRQSDIGSEGVYRLSTRFGQRAYGYVTRDSLFRREFFLCTERLASFLGRALLNKQTVDYARGVIRSYRRPLPYLYEKTVVSATGMLPYCTQDRFGRVVYVYEGLSKAFGREIVGRLNWRRREGE